MTELIVALAVFLAAHVVPAAGPLRRALVGRLGEAVYLILYSLLSLGLLAWVVVAYDRAAYVEAWPPTEATRWVTLVAMPFACLLIVAGLTSPNPLSLGAGARGYDPARPGIVSVSRHPALWGLALWAASHVPPNGDAASLLVFGLLFALGAAGPLLLDRKRRRSLGKDAWRRLAAPTASLPFAAILAGRATLDWRGIGIWRTTGAILLYVAMLFLHESLIGASPWPA